MQAFPRFHLFLALFLTTTFSIIYFLLPSFNELDNRRISLDLQAETSASIPAEISKIDASTKNLLKIEVKTGDNLADIFQRNGISASEFQSVIKKKSTANSLEKLLPGEELWIETSSNGSLLSIEYWKNSYEKMLIKKRGETFEASWHSIETEILPAFASGEISKSNPSLYKAGKAFGLSDSIIMEMADIFQWDISFALDLRDGDSFSIIYEKVYLDGIATEDGKILAANFSNMGKTYNALIYRNIEGEEGYYDERGRPLRKAFIRDPVHFSHVSSSFNLRRMHPIHKRVMPHRGIDYAAAKGTPVVSSSDGRVITKRKNAASGNYLEIKHGEIYVTKYLHLSRFARGINLGSSVKQGQTIGYVGETGWATAPHLHYEFLVNGVHRNPRKIKLPESVPILSKEMKRFLSQISPKIKQLETISLRSLHKK